MKEEGQRKVAWKVEVKRRGLLADTFYQYTANTSIHGLKYVGDYQRPPIERLFWIVAFILAGGAAAYFIASLFSRFRESPVIMSLTPTTIPISDIPFPAVTICNMNNLRKSNAEAIMQWGSTTDKNLVRDLCQSSHHGASNYTDTNITAKWEYIQKLMVEVSQPCHEMLVACHWRGESYYCPEIFNPTLTDEGMCCTFNSIKEEFIFNNPRSLSNLNVTFTRDSIDWTPEKGFPEDASATSLPWRPAGAGSHMGLSIVVDAEIDEYYCSSENSVGFKVLLHNQIETPKISSFGTVVTPGKESRVSIVPRIVASGGNMENIDIKKRQCYLSGERLLRFYKTYSQMNCIRECEANFTITYCSCVLFYMPKDNTTRICGRKDGRCANYAKRVMELSPGDPDYSSDNFKNLKPCQCLPGCFDVGYNMALSASPLSNSLHIRDSYLNKKTKNYFKENMAIVHFFFVETQFTGTLRTRLFGFTEFLSNTGGLLGLFMGFSFLSAVEIVYFLTLRLCFSYSQQPAEVAKEKKITKIKYPLFEFIQ